MMDRKIDLDLWPRKELYTHFSHTSSPFWAVTYEEDVTEILAYARKNRLSFYHTMIWAVTKAVNEVKAFHYTIRDDGIYELENRLPSFTSMKEESELFQIITADQLQENIADFCAYAKELENNQKEFICYEKESDALIFVSCLPWIHVSGLTNEGMTDPSDSIPRIAWGRFAEEKGRVMISMSFEINHRLIDGIHIGQFHEAFRMIAASLAAKNI